mgnify:CR=1 FL=1
MVVGDRSHLTSTLRSAYRGAGLSHVLVVSGMHVSILCGDVLGRLLPSRKKRLHGYTGRRVRALFSAVLALLLVGVTGFTPLFCARRGPSGSVRWGSGSTARRMP